MANNHEEDSNGQPGSANKTDNVQTTSTDNNNNKQVQVQVQVQDDNKESQSACYSPSTSSEDDDFFQIEGPAILSTQFSLDNNELLSIPDPKRIPSSVFERSKSKANNTADWSITSNESLFSINVGNTSFSNDYMVLYGKSGGDMGSASDPLAPLPPLPRQSSSMIVNGGGEMVNREKAESSSADTEKKADCANVGTDGSTPSFAFPILTGDERHSKDSSTNPDLSRQSTAQLSQLPEPDDDDNDDDEGSPEGAITTAPKVEEAPVPAAMPAEQPPPAATAKWFPCCSCCPLCG